MAATQTLEEQHLDLLQRLQEALRRDHGHAHRPDHGQHQGQGLLLQGRQQRAQRLLPQGRLPRGQRQRLLPAPLQQVQVLLLQGLRRSQQGTPVRSMPCAIPGHCSGSRGAFGSSHAGAPGDVRAQSS